MSLATFDSTLALLRQPYEFISKTCRRLGTDVFQTRILLRRTICMSGPEAARVFYDPDRLQRRGAAPSRFQKTLFGVGGVQGLDGEPHLHRKQMFMSLMTPQRIGQLGEISAGLWHSYARKWATMERVVLYDELHELLTRAVCDWAGVPLEESEVARRTREITALFDYAGTIGPKYWWSRAARKLADHWIDEVIEQVRSRKLNPPPQSALHVIAHHRDLSGGPLAPHVAAVEVLNVLRPTVAVAVYIVFVAHALHEHPRCRARLESGEDDGYTERFAQEVRRFYPFFPSVIALVRRDFQWNGYRFPQGRPVILDLYGTNHDPRAWDAPDEFRPERFGDYDGDPFTFIPQGGGDPHVHHRCPGEPIALELMKVAAEFLTRRMKYDVPEQDLPIDFDRLPALPRSRFIINNVRTDFDRTPANGSHP